MKKALVAFILILLPLSALAQSTETMNIGDVSVYYNSTLEEEGSVYYFLDDEIVLSDHSGGVTLFYKNGELHLEGHDLDGDGELDAYFELDSNESVTETRGEGVDVFKKPIEESFESLIEGESEEDLVGDLSDIKIPGRGSLLTKLSVLVVVLVGGYILWNRRKKQSDIPEEE